jgi:hypothetical protein
MPDLFDYAPLLIKIDQLERRIHDLCLEKQHKEAIPLVDELMEQCVVLKKWLKAQK